MARNSAADLLTSVDSLFTTQAERDIAAQPRVEDISLTQIDDFPNHPFKVRMDESMQEMADSVKQYGVLVPAIVRPKENGRYEMVAGHRRKTASELASRAVMPCVVRDLTDEEATIIMVDSNLQREQILPSEKAFAYKMKLDAMKRQGQRNDLTCAPLGHKLENPKSRDIVARESGDSKSQIQRYIRLTNLTPELLDLVDNSVLKEKDKMSNFQNVYDDLKKKLIAKGIPAEEIAFIHEANTEVRKKELFARVRSGQVRVLMGSTAKMGAGTNVQDKLIALHDLDCPWRPSDLAQRLGRIVRQGNQNPEVEIFRYVTENTFDAYLYQLVENKQKFISQIMTSKAPARIADDVDETALSYSEIKALATGNPLIIEKCNLDVEVSKLNMLKANHLNQRFSLENLVLRKYPAAIAELTERISGYEKDVSTAKAHPRSADTFVGMEVLGTSYTERKEAGKAIINACTSLNSSDPVPLGQYRGFSLTLVYDSAKTDYRLTLKGSLSHTISLSADAGGNITRMDNVVDGLEKMLETQRLALEEVKTQLTNAKAEMEAPFAKEAELAEKSARLKELNILLNMDQKDTSLLDEGPISLYQEKKSEREIER